MGREYIVSIYWVGWAHSIYTYIYICILLLGSYVSLPWRPTTNCRRPLLATGRWASCGPRTHPDHSRSNQCFSLSHLLLYESIKPHRHAQLRSWVIAVTACSYNHRHLTTLPRQERPAEERNDLLLHLRCFFFFFLFRSALIDLYSRDLYTSLGDVKVLLDKY